MPRSSSRRPAGSLPNHRGRPKVQREIGHGFGSFSRPERGWVPRGGIELIADVAPACAGDRIHELQERDTMSTLQGRRAWITGASSGIGSATARVLSAAGAEVVLSARRADKIEALAEEIRTPGRVALVRPLDVTDKAASERIGRELAGSGGIHVLVNNAGVMPLSPVLEDRVHE